MIISRRLSKKQQRTGRNKLLSFSFLNGIALTFITGNVLSLYLLKIGFSTPATAIIISLGYAGALFTFSGKWLIAKYGASLTVRYSWILCGIAAILLSLIPFVYTLSFVTYYEILLTAAIFLFYSIFKSIGTSAVPPLMGEFIGNTNEGKFTSKYYLLFSVSKIIAIFILIFLYFGFKTLLIYQVLIFSGGVIKILCSFIFGTMHETTIPRESAKAIGTNKRLKYFLKNNQYKSFLIFRTFARTGLILVIPFSILALKMTYNVSDRTALIFACIQLLGGFCITYIYGVISDYSGSKPLIIINIVILFIICLLWLYAPPFLMWEYIAIIFFIGGACLFGLDSSLSHYYLKNIPKEDRVGVSLWSTIIGGAAAGIFGVLLGGGLIKLYSMLTTYENVFKCYYTTMFILLIPVLYYACTLKATSQEVWSISKVLMFFFIPGKFYSLYKIRNHRKFSSTKAELHYVGKLSGMSPDLSEKHLIYYLKSPDYFVRTNALHRMEVLELGEKSKNALYTHIMTRVDYNLPVASCILAKNNFTKALPLFRKRLRVTNPLFVVSSMLALAIMNDKESYNKIISIFNASADYHILFNGARALGIIKAKNAISCMLEKLTYRYSLYRLDKIKSDINRELEDELVIAITKIISCNGVFYKYLRSYRNNKNIGLLELIDTIDNSKASGLSIAPNIILEYYYNSRSDPERKLKFINYLIAALDRDIPEMKELKVLKDYLTTTEPNIILKKLLACIFIKLFCNNEPTDEDTIE